MSAVRTAEGDANALGRAVAARFRLGPTSRPRPAPIGSLALASLRFAAATGHHPAIRRSLSGPGTWTGAASHVGAVRPPRWWLLARPTEVVRTIDIDALPPRGLPLAVRGRLAEGPGPGKISTELATRVAAVPREREVAAVGAMVHPGERAVSAPQRGVPGARPGASPVQRRPAGHAHARVVRPPGNAPGAAAPPAAPIARAAVRSRPSRSEPHAAGAGATSPVQRPLAPVPTADSPAADSPADARVTQGGSLPERSVPDRAVPDRAVPATTPAQAPQLAPPTAAGGPQRVAGPASALLRRHVDRAAPPLARDAYPLDAGGASEPPVVAKQVAGWMAPAATAAPTAATPALARRAGTSPRVLSPTELSGVFTTAHRRSAPPQRLDRWAGRRPAAATPHRGELQRGASAAATAAAPARTAAARSAPTLPPGLAQRRAAVPPAAAQRSQSGPVQAGPVLRPGPTLPRSTQAGPTRSPEAQPAHVAPAQAAALSRATPPAPAAAHHPAVGVLRRSLGRRPGASATLPSSRAPLTADHTPLTADRAPLTADRAPDRAPSRAKGLAPAVPAAPAVPTFPTFPARPPAVPSAKLPAEAVSRWAEGTHTAGKPRRPHLAAARGHAWQAATPRPGAAVQSAMGMHRALGETLLAPPATQVPGGPGGELRTGASVAAVAPPRGTPSQTATPRGPEPPTPGVVGTPARMDLIGSSGNRPPADPAIANVNGMPDESVALQGAVIRRSWPSADPPPAELDAAPRPTGDSGLPVAPPAALSHIDVEELVDLVVARLEERVSDQLAIRGFTHPEVY